MNLPIKGHNTSKDGVITFFEPTGPWAELSNFFRHGFELDDLAWPSVEHYYQAAKSLDLDVQQQIRQAATPREAKNMGRAIPNLRPDWEQVKETVMRSALKAKFSHPKLREILLASGDRPIEERSPYDSYWGTGGDGQGKNRLGQLLMELRTTMLHPQNSKHRIWIEGCEPNPEQLAEKMGDLYYDALADYLRLLADKIDADGLKDSQRGRIKLGRNLANAAAHLQQAAMEIDNAWEVCQPFVEEWGHANKG